MEIGKGAVHPITGLRMSDEDWETPRGEVPEICRDLYDELRSYNAELVERMNGKRLGERGSKQDAGVV